jgi:hypothetical protein
VDLKSREPEACPENANAPGGEIAGGAKAFRGKVKMIEKPSRRRLAVV